MRERDGEDDGRNGKKRGRINIEKVVGGDRQRERERENVLVSFYSDVVR